MLEALQIVRQRLQPHRLAALIDMSFVLDRGKLQGAVELGTVELRQARADTDAVFEQGQLRR